MAGRTSLPPFPQHSARNFGPRPTMMRAGDIWPVARASRRAAAYRGLRFVLLREDATGDSLRPRPNPCCPFRAGDDGNTATQTQNLHSVLLQSAVLQSNVRRFAVSYGKTCLRERQQRGSMVPETAPTATASKKHPAPGGRTAVRPSGAGGGNRRCDGRPSRRPGRRRR